MVGRGDGRNRGLTNRDSLTRIGTVGGCAPNGRVRPDPGEPAPAFRGGLSVHRFVGTPGSLSGRARFVTAMSPRYTMELSPNWAMSLPARQGRGVSCPSTHRASSASAPSPARRPWQPLSTGTQDVTHLYSTRPSLRGYYIAGKCALKRMLSLAQRLGAVELGSTAPQNPPLAPPTTVY